MSTNNHLKEGEKRWFAIYTKIKCEKYVLDKLEQKDIEGYMPLIKRVKKYTSKIKRYEVPLINSYVFVKIEKKEYLPVLQTDYVYKFIKQGKELISIPDREIDLLKRVVGEFEVELGSVSGEYEIGQKVEVISGDLTGVKGVLLEQKNRNDFVIDLITVGVQLRIQIDRNLLRPV